MIACEYGINNRKFVSVCILNENTEEKQNKNTDCCHEIVT